MAASFNWTPNAQAALLRSSTGEIVGTTWAGTMCLWPRKPSQYLLAGDKDDDQVIARCFNCPGCREFDRRVLARRLHDRYADVVADLWLVIVQCPRLLQPVLSRNLRRSRHFKVQGFYRLGADACAFIAVGSKPQPWRARVLRRRQVQVHRIRRRRGLRAWAMLTAGMLRERAEYGQWLNRFYHRGLPARSRDRAWTFSSAGGIGKRHQVAGEDQLRAPARWRRGPRAARGEVLLIPPSEWKLPRLLASKGPKAGQSALSGQMRAILEAMVKKLSAPDLRVPRLSPARASAPSDSLNLRIAGNQPATALAEYRTIKFLDRTGYKGSLQVHDRQTANVVQEIAEWKARMEAIERRRRSD